MKNRIRDQIRYKQIVKIIVGLAIFAAIWRIFGDIDDLDRSFRIQWHLIWHVLYLTLFINLLTAFRWHLILRKITNNSRVIPLFKLMQLGRMAGHSTSQIAGDIGFRMIYLRQRGIDYKKGTITILYDKIFEIVFLAVLLSVFTGMVLLKINSVYYPVFALLCLVIYAAMVFILPWVLNTLPSKVIRYKFKDIQISGTRFAVALITVTRFVVSAMRYYVVFLICGIDLQFIRAFFGTSAAHLGMITGITPGGLGFVEAGWAGVLHYYAIPSDSVAQFLIIQRILVFGSVAVLTVLFSIDTIGRRIKRAGTAL